MATVSDITTTPLSGLNYIDALLDKGPDWNYFTPAANAPANTLYYTFSIATGTEDAQSTQASFTGNPQAFSASQQAATRTAFGYLASITGIKFVETTAGTDAQIHLCNVNLIGSNVTGLCSWHSSYGYSGSQLASYDADAYVYLDNAEWASQNGNLTPGGYGYETLLHELGHALGLKHPFDTTTDNSTTLSASQDSTLNTLMSYNYQGGAHAQYQQDDLAALAWLYGGDGLKGALGINSTTGGRYLMGSSAADTLVGTTANDTFEGNGGNDMIYGGGGNDTAVFNGVRNNYNISVLNNGDLQVAGTSGSDGTDTLHAIGTLQFTDMSVSRDAIMAAATGGPDVPTIAVTKNGNGYATGNTPVVTGQADAGDIVKIYTTDNVVVGTATADNTGLFSVTLSPFNDGLNYQVYATATNSAGVTSTQSALASFNIDAHAPAYPTASMSMSSSGNVVTFSGTGEAGTILDVMLPGATADDTITVAETKVGSDGKWSVTTSPLPNGTYNLRAVSSDLADNVATAKTAMSFTVANAGNVTGSAGNDTLSPKAANTAIDGGAGIDTVSVNGARANFTVAKETWGYGLTDNTGTGGHDALINVERVHFKDADVALDVNGNAGEVFRVYQAAFDRPAEAAGLGYWIWRMDNGTSLNQVALEFTKQVEFTNLYGSNPTDADFVNRVYTNVLHRPAEGAGFDYWMDAIEHQGVSRAQVLAFFSESPENQAQVIGSIQNGMTFTPWVQS